VKLKEVTARGYYAYEVPEAVRERLAQIIPPKNPEWIGHHITTEFNVPYNPDNDGLTGKVKVWAYAYEDGLDAFAVNVNGDSKRYDGKQLHITWSLDRSKGKKPVDSNALMVTANFASLVGKNIVFEAPLKFYPF